MSIRKGGAESDFERRFIDTPPAPERENERCQYCGHKRFKIIDCRAVCAECEEPIGQPPSTVRSEDAAEAWLSRANEDVVAVDKHSEVAPVDEAAALAAEQEAHMAKLCAALRDYKQCDEDGVMCIVSRQAVHEAIEWLSILSSGMKNLEAADDELKRSHIQRGEALEAMQMEKLATHAHAQRLLDALHPGLVLHTSITGVIDQIDNVTVGLKQRAEAAEGRVAELAKAVLDMKHELPNWSGSKLPLPKIYELGDTRLRWINEADWEQMRMLAQSASPTRPDVAELQQEKCLACGHRFIGSHDCPAFNYP